MSSTADPVVRMDADEVKGKAPARSRVKDLYATMKKHQAQLEFMDITEEYLKDEMRNLKRELIRAKEEVKRIQSVPLVVSAHPPVPSRGKQDASLRYSRRPLSIRFSYPSALPSLIHHRSASSTSSSIARQLW